MAGSAWNPTVTQESVRALRNMRDELEDLSRQLKAEVAMLQQVYEENKNGLGPHSDEIARLLQQLGATAGEAEVPVKKLQKKLVRAASIRENLMQDSAYSHSR